MRTIGIAAVIGARQRLIASWLWSAERVRGALEVLGERSASCVLVGGEVTRQVSCACLLFVLVPLFMLGI
jgi:hypothetical protein